MSHATFDAPDLTMFCRLDDLGLEAAWVPSRWMECHDLRVGSKGPRIRIRDRQRTGGRGRIRDRVWWNG
ncbi:hypothetical protein [Arthrobacter sp. H20]|uniref:hypothetical protein n=1 Tax=Arthrobacter sp. H20 TaxID=1267981 RepID=UPI00047A0AEC|nr:hypothetical protein [Arthrobacter sp. H20]